MATHQQGDLALTVWPLPGDLRTAQSLTPEIARLLAEEQTELSEVECLAVAVGPGSFTGLRLGVTAAKTLAYAKDIDLVAVDTLDAWAYGRSYPTRLWAVFDAGRGQLAAACYDQGDPAVAAAELPRPIIPAELVTVEAWRRLFKEGDAVCGPQVERLRPALPPDATVLSSQEPLAGNVARVGRLLHEAGRTSDPMKLVPNYYRPSAAEEKAAARS